MEYEFTILTMPSDKQMKISFGQICKRKEINGDYRLRSCHGHAVL